jgi:hypothetical protein
VGFDERSEERGGLLTLTSWSPFDSLPTRTMKVDDTRDEAGAGRRTGRFCGSSRQALRRFHTEMASVPVPRSRSYALQLRKEREITFSFLGPRSGTCTDHTYSYVVMFVHLP